MAGDVEQVAGLSGSALGGVSDADLVAEICALAAGIDRASARMLVLFGELDARSGWAWPGVMSMVHWVSWKLHIGRHAASEQVRVARSLRELPLMQAAFVDGRLSYSKVRALSRIATPSDEEDLVRLGVHATAAMIDRTVAAWRRCDAVDADLGERAARRRVSWWWDEDGMLRLSARLDAEEGAVVLAALQAVESAHRTGDGAGAAADPPAGADRASALAGIAQLGEDEQSPRGLSGPSPRSDRQDGESCGVPATGVIEPANGEAEKSPRGLSGPSPRGSEREHGGRLEVVQPPSAPAADALVALARAFLNGDGDTGRDPDTEMVITVDSAVLSGGAGAAAYRSGGALTGEQARRIACDTKLVVVLAENSGVLDVSAASRTIPAPIRRALLVRDRGCCAMPGCTETRPSRLHAHHVWHWADGGPTVLDNLVSLCQRHHRAIHEDGYRVTAARGRFTFTDPSGRVIPAVDEPAEHTRAVPVVDPDTVPAWDGTPFDLDYVMAVLLSRRKWRRDQQTRLAQAHGLATAA